MTTRRRENKIKDWNKRTYLLDSQFLLLYSVRLMQLTLSYSCRFNWIGYCSYYSLSVSSSSGVVNFLFLFHISPKTFLVLLMHFVSYKKTDEFFFLLVFKYTHFTGNLWRISSISFFSHLLFFSLSLHISLQALMNNKHILRWKQKTKTFRIRLLNDFFYVYEIFK